MGASSGSRTGTRELERRPATWVWGMPLLTHDPDELNTLGEVTAAVSASVTAIRILPPTGNSSVGTQSPGSPPVARRSELHVWSRAGEIGTRDLLTPSQ